MAQQESDSSGGERSTGTAGTRSKRQCALAVETAKAKFDETVEIAVRLGVDPRQADQNVRGTVVLPHGTGKSVRVLVFAKGEKEREATEAGADVVGGEDLVKKITERLARVRQGDRDARHDGLGRSHRQDARPARLDAEPEGRHRHLRCRQGGQRAQGR